jgi:hypothetical protein
VCANEECRNLSLGLDVGKHTGYQNSKPVLTDPIGSWQLLPASSARPQPDYIPEALRRDYEEACAIRDLSPKVSATITRRCIQGIIRDFCCITKRRLIASQTEMSVSRLSAIIKARTCAGERAVVGVTDPIGTLPKLSLSDLRGNVAKGLDRALPPPRWGG